MITVWGRRNSMNVQKVMWTLGELGLDYERHDMAGSFGVTDEYVGINPNRVVPAIEDGDLTLYESNACVRYLARQYGMGSLCPEDPAQAAVADQWMDWQCSTFGPAFFLIFFNKVRVPAEQRNDGKIEQGLAQTAHLLTQLEAVLSKQDYSVGDSFSMADIPLGAMLYRYFTMDIERPVLPAVLDYYERLTGRVAYQHHVMIPYGRNVDEWLQEERKNAGIQ